MKEINNNLLNELIDLSHYLGINLNWVQGAGGNTSVKDNQNLFVKASGYWLSDAKKNNIFSKLDLKKLLILIDQGDENLSSAQIVDENCESLRPSIETTLHALMPHRYVVHVHSTNVISSAVLKNSNKLLKEKLIGINWLLIPYVRPGLPLTKMLMKLNAHNFDVLILANHGIVIGGESKAKVIELLLEIEKKLYKPIRAVISSPDINKLNTLIKNSKYKLPKYDYCHSLAKDKISLEIVRKNPLYPDHIIFLGPGAIPVISEDEFNLKLSNPLYEILNKVIIIKDVGVVIHEELSDNAEEMLYCLTSVNLKIENQNNLNHLSNEDEMELLGWDAEKYRKSIER